ncbi:MAG: Crp/Fnr family transcriptional regulator [Saprospiraceae bacterium]
METLRNIVSHYNGKIPEQDIKNAYKYCKEFRIKKGELLSNEGDVVDSLYFMHKGCIVLYAAIHGVEKPIEFFTENDIFTDFYSYVKEVPSRGYMRAVENCVIISIKKSDFEYVLQNSHPLEHFGRKFLEDRHLNVLIDFQNNAVLSNEERYLRLIRKRPYLFQRVPQYLIAAYLGLTPVGLSKIRKRLSER